MAENSPSDDLLLKYLDGEMSSEEKEVFEREIASDPVLQNRVREFQLAQDSVRYYGLNQKVAAVRKEWESANETASDPVKVVPILRRIRTQLAVAAGILILVVAVKMLWFSVVPADKIYDETFVSYQLGTTRSDDIAASKIETAWKEKKYDEVIRLSQGSSMTDKNKLLLGLAYLQKNESTKAIPVLNEIAKNRNNPYHDDAEFYLGMAYLKNKEYAKALTVLTSINKNEYHLYHKQVTDHTIEEIEDLH